MKRKNKSFEFTPEYSKLATYNGEKARGIIHTEEWKTYMATVQERYDRQTKKWYSSE